MLSQITVTTESLRRLHRIHQQLQDLKERLERGPRIAKAHEANLSRVEQQLAELRAKADSLRKSANAKQDQLQRGEANVARRRQQLREAKDNREYQALVDQIAADQMANSVLADEALEAMERLDEVNKKVAEAEAAAAKARSQAQHSAEEAVGQGPKIQADLERLTAELRKTEQELPAEFQEVYQRLVRAKGSDALAPMLGEFCGGCNHHVPVNMYNSMALSKPVFCRSCGRLLYLPEDRMPGR